MATFDTNFLEHCLEITQRFDPAPYLKLISAASHGDLTFRPLFWGVDSLFWPRMDKAGNLTASVSVYLTMLPQGKELPDNSTEAFPVLGVLVDEDVQVTSQRLRQAIKSLIEAKDEHLVKMGEPLPETT